MGLVTLRSEETLSQVVIEGQQTLRSFQQEFAALEVRAKQLEVKREEMRHLARETFGGCSEEERAKIALLLMLPVLQEAQNSKNTEAAGTSISTIRLNSVTRRQGIVKI